MGRNWAPLAMMLNNARSGRAMTHQRVTLAFEQPVRRSDVLQVPVLDLEATLAGLTRAVEQLLNAMVAT